VDDVQVARNDAIFRDANERIERAAVKFAGTDPVPFICECAEPSCRDVILLPLAEYERVREHSTWFVVTPGHEASAGDSAEIVETKDGYHVVEKVGRAAEVAAELDPRSGQWTSARDG
jgi:hypothetical protein